MEFDHVFICVKANAPEADKLSAFGFTEGSANVHPGQGTANRRFFFQNAFIELLYLNNLEELTSDLTQPTMLAERLSGEMNASPFGVCFRPSSENKNAALTPQEPFKSWAYKPQYLPPTMQVDVGVAPVTEPMWFYLPFASRPDHAVPERAQPLAHNNGFKEITAVRISINTEEPYSDAANAAKDNAMVTLLDEDQPLLEIGFDNETQGKAQDFRPDMPLIIKW